MKKINFRSSQVPLGLLTILLTTNLVFAGGPQTIQDWLGLVESKTLGVESKIQSLEALISVANKKLAELKQQLASGNDPQCAYIRPNGSPITYPNVQAMNNAGAFSISPGKCEDVPKGLFPAGISVSTSPSTNNGCQKISQTLWEGQNNNNYIEKDIINLQQFLNNYIKYNYAGGAAPALINVDGVYGNATTQLVKFVQNRQGIKQTGSVGPLTLAKINSMICGSSTKEVKVIETEKFTIELPPDWTYTPKQGIDSFVGEFSNGKDKFTFDYGRYGGSIIENPGDGHTEKPYVLNGKRVQISSEAGHFGVYFEIATGLGLRIGGQGTGYNILMKSIETVKFK